MAENEIMPRLLSVADTAKYIGISAKTLRNRMSKGHPRPFPIKPIRNGGRVLFDKKAVDAWIDSLGGRCG